MVRFLLIVRPIDFENGIPGIFKAINVHTLINTAITRYFIITKWDDVYHFLRLTNDRSGFPCHHSYSTGK